MLSGTVTSRQANIQIQIQMQIHFWKDTLLLQSSHCLPPTLSLISSSNFLLKNFRSSQWCPGPLGPYGYHHQQEVYSRVQDTLPGAGRPLRLGKASFQECEVWGVGVVPVRVMNRVSLSHPAHSLKDASHVLPNTVLLETASLSPITVVGVLKT